VSYSAKLSKEITPILYAKAKRENKKIDQLVNEILKIVLWDEPECLFKGKKYRLEAELFEEQQVYEPP
jgi:hypothetical protein